MEELQIILDLEIIQNILISLALGALIGLEREHHRKEESGGKTIIIAGIRTFPMVALCGTLLAILMRISALPNSPIPPGGYFSFLIPLGLLGFILLAVVMFYAKHQLEITGLTTPVTLIATFLIGVLAGFGFKTVGIICGIAITLLLVSKRKLHQFASVLTDDEIISALGFIAIAFVLFPLAPDKPVDRYGLFNLRWVLSIIVFVSTISFISFLAMKRYGVTKGILFSSMLGGIVNSEATTASLSYHVAADKQITDIVVKGIVISNATMLVRNLIIAGFAEPTMNVLRFMLIPVCIMCIGNFAIVSATARILTAKRDLKIEIKSPFAITPAVKFGGLFALVAACGYAVTYYLGGNWIYLTAIGGIASSGAVVASLAMLAYQFPGQVSVAAISGTCVLACVVSTLTNILIASFSSKELAKKIARYFIITAIAGIVATAAVLYIVHP